MSSKYLIKWLFHTTKTVIITTLNVNKSDRNWTVYRESNDITQRSIVVRNRAKMEIAMTIREL